MAKLLLVLIVIGALADGLSPNEPPLLIDAPQAAPLDAGD